MWDYNTIEYCMGVTYDRWNFSDKSLSDIFVVKLHYWSIIGTYKQISYRHLLCIVPMENFCGLIWNCKICASFAHRKLFLYGSTYIYNARITAHFMYLLFGSNLCSYWFNLTTIKMYVYHFYYFCIQYFKIHHQWDPWLL